MLQRIPLVSELSKVTYRAWYRSRDSNYILFICKMPCSIILKKLYSLPQMSSNKKLEASIIFVSCQWNFPFLVDLEFDILQLKNNAYNSYLRHVYMHLHCLYVSVSHFHVYIRYSTWYVFISSSLILSYFGNCQIYGYISNSIHLVH
jgi:hypothetical protein